MCLGMLLGGRHLVRYLLNFVFIYKWFYVILFECPLVSVCVDGPRCKTLIGAVDYSWLFTYAVFLFIR